MDNFNLDENMVNKLKNMMGDKNVSDAISNLSPEMIENFSKMMNSNSSSTSSDASSSNSTSSDSNPFENIDVQTIMKMKGMMDKFNNSDNSRTNLLNSLKPYLRDTRKDKIDQYINLLKITDIAGFLNNDNKKEPNSND